MSKEWIQTDDGSYTLFHSEFGETYHSKAGAWSECLSVFVDPFVNSKFLYNKKNWRILDIGHGMGLNWLAFMNLYLHRTTPVFTGQETQSDQSLTMASLENDPEVVSILIDKSRLGLFPIHDHALDLHAKFRREGRIQTDTIDCQLLLNDIRQGVQTLIESQSKFDLILFDAFSPKRNPECWRHDIFEMVSLCCEPGTMLMSFSVASEVRRSLEQVGFEVDKQKGFGHKREKLVAIFQPAK